MGISTKMISPLPQLPQPPLVRSYGRPAYVIPNIPWYDNSSTLLSTPTNFETIVIGGFQDYFFMTSFLFMIRISNMLLGHKDISVINRLTDPYINLSRRLIRSPNIVVQISIASMLVSTLFYSTVVYGCDLHTQPANFLLKNERKLLGNSYTPRRNSVRCPCCINRLSINNVFRRSGFTPHPQWNILWQLYDNHIHNPNIYFKFGSMKR